MKRSNQRISAPPPGSLSDSSSSDIIRIVDRFTDGCGRILYRVQRRSDRGFEWKFAREMKDKKIIKEFEDNIKEKKKAQSRENSKEEENQGQPEMFEAKETRWATRRPQFRMSIAHKEEQENPSNYVETPDSPDSDGKSSGFSSDFFEEPRKFSGGQQREEERENFPPTLCPTQINSLGFVVENILSHRLLGSALLPSEDFSTAPPAAADVEYLVHWEDFSDSENSWEPGENLTQCKEAINDYWIRYRKNRKKTR